MNALDALARDVVVAEERRRTAERVYIGCDPADDEVYRRARAQLDAAQDAYLAALERHFRACERARETAVVEAPIVASALDLAEETLGLCIEGPGTTAAHLCQRAAAARVAIRAAKAAMARRPR